MPRVNDMFPSTWLKAADLNEQDVTLTIAGVNQEVVGQEDNAESKWVVYFDEVRKGLVLNKTNANTLSSALGDDTDDWIGRKVVLYPTEVNFSGKMVEAIRIKEKATKNLLKQTSKPAPQPPARKQTAPPVTQSEADEATDEDLPF